MKIHLTTRKGFNLFSWLIRKFMGTEYSHSGLEFQLYGGSFIFEATAFFGVRIVTRDRWFQANRLIETIPVPCTIKGKQAIKYCMDRLGAEYSFMSIIGIALGDPGLGRDGESKFQCSEIIARAFGIKGENLDHLDVKQLKEAIGRCSHD